MRKVVILDNGSPVGYFGVWPDKEIGVFQSGSAIIEEHKGRGLANKARSAVIDYLVEQEGAIALTTYVDPITKQVCA